MTALPWTIARLGSDDELTQVAALEAATFSNPWTREMLARELQNAEVTRVYVIKVPGRGIVGFCACWIILDELHINTVAVDAPARRRGLATRLLEHVFEDAAAAGVERATLEVRRSNHPALRLYEQLGFVVTSVRPNYYTQPEEDALILWRQALRDVAPDASGSHP